MIDRRSDDGEIEPLAPADIAVGEFADMEGKAEDDWRLPGPRA